MLPNGLESTHNWLCGLTRLAEIGKAESNCNSKLTLGLCCISAMLPWYCMEEDSIGMKQMIVRTERGNDKRTKQKPVVPSRVFAVSNSDMCREPASDRFCITRSLNKPVPHDVQVHRSSSAASCSKTNFATNLGKLGRAHGPLNTWLG